MRLVALSAAMRCVPLWGRGGVGDPGSRIPKPAPPTDGGCFVNLAVPVARSPASAEAAAGFAPTRSGLSDRSRNISPSANHGFLSAERAASGIPG